MFRRCDIISLCMMVYSR